MIPNWFTRFRHTSSASKDEEINDYVNRYVSQQPFIGTL